MSPIASTCTTGWRDNDDAIDTNLLIYAHRSDLITEAAAPSRKPGRTVAAGDHNAPDGRVLEASVGGPSTPRQAHSFLRELVDAGAAVWTPRVGFWERLLRVATDLRVSGVRIYDLQIALVAFENGASEVWTHDARFSTVPGLSVHDPL